MTNILQDVTSKVNSNISRIMEINTPFDKHPIQYKTNRHLPSD